MSTGSMGSAKRAFAILELFAELRRPANVTDIWRRLGHPQSSTSKLLNMLAGMGYLSYDGDTRRYVPTLRAAFLGSWLHDQWFSHVSLLGVMEGLRAQLGTSVILGIQNDKHVLYMLTLKGTLPGFNHPRPDLPVGALRPLCRAAVGKALLTALDDGSVGRLVRRINAEEPDMAQHIPLPELLSELAEAREHGFAFNKGTFLHEVGVLAMLLPKLPGQPQMAIGLSAPLAWYEENLHAAEAALRAALVDVHPTIE